MRTVTSQLFPTGQSPERSNLSQSSNSRTKQQPGHCSCLYSPLPLFLQVERLNKGVRSIVGRFFRREETWRPVTRSPAGCPLSTRVMHFQQTSLFRLPKITNRTCLYSNVTPSLSPRVSTTSARTMIQSWRPLRRSPSLLRESQVKVCLPFPPTHLLPRR